MKNLTRGALTAAIAVSGLLPVAAVSPAAAADSPTSSDAPAATCASPSWTPSTGVIAASCKGPGAVLFHVKCASPGYDRSSGWLIVPTAGRTMTHLFPVCNGTSQVSVSTRAL